MKNSFNQVSFEDLYIELMEKSELSFCYAKTKVELTLKDKGEKEVSISVCKQYGDMHGRHYSTLPFYYRLRKELQETFLTVAGKPLPLTDKPVNYVWFINIRGRRYPIAIQPDPVNLQDYIVSNPQSATKDDDEYCFEIDPVMTPLLNYPRDGNLIFIPVGDIWREVSSELHIEQQSLVEVIAATAVAKYKGWNL